MCHPRWWFKVCQVCYMRNMSVLSIMHTHSYMTPFLLNPLPLFRPSTSCSFPYPLVIDKVIREIKSNTKYINVYMHAIQDEISMVRIILVGEDYKLSFEGRREIVKETTNFMRKKSIR